MGINTNNCSQTTATKKPQASTSKIASSVSRVITQHQKEIELLSKK